MVPLEEILDSSRWGCLMTGTLVYLGDTTLVSFSLPIVNDTIKHCVQVMQEWPCVDGLSEALLILWETPFITHFYSAVDSRCITTWRTDICCGMAPMWQSLLLSWRVACASCPTPVDVWERVFTLHLRIANQQDMVRQALSCQKLSFLYSTLPYTPFQLQSYSPFLQ